MRDNHFIILVVVYNSKEYIARCLDSAIDQTYKNYDLIVVDDRSTDGTWEIIQKYDCIKHRNETHMGDSLPNTIMALRLYSKDKEDIIVHLDGDDCLAGDFVLEHLNNVYQEDIWLTYGQYEPMGHKYHNYCKPIQNTHTYRKSGKWTTSHLKTWKRWLWGMIKDEDLRNGDGNYMNASSDRAFMYPMIEMAGEKHIKFIERILYLYNDLNPDCCMSSRPEELISAADYLMSKEEYREL